MNQTRLLKVDLAITLAQGKILNLANYVRLADQPVARKDYAGGWPGLLELLRKYCQ